VLLVKDEAQIAAKQILETKWNGTFPVDPVKIAGSLGIDVKTATFRDAGTSGAIIANSPQDVTIYVAASESLPRQTFTCAHEIGHFIERGTAKDPEYSFVENRTTSYDLHEFFADEFAGNLLMPEKQFVALWKSEASLSTIANFFAVSYGATEHRLKRLRRERKL